MATDPETPLGHSTPSHPVLGWCSHCPGRSVPEELAAWQVDALDRALGRNDEMEQLRTTNERMRHELEVMYGGAFDRPKPAPAVEAQQPTPALAAADCPYGAGPGDGSGCIKPSGHDGDHIVIPGVQVLPCSQAVLHQPHIPHTWSPQPGMTYAHCPGVNPTQAEETK